MSNELELAASGHHGVQRLSVSRPSQSAAVQFHEPSALADIEEGRRLSNGGVSPKVEDDNKQKELTPPSGLSIPQLVNRGVRVGGDQDDDDSKNKSSRNSDSESSNASSGSNPKKGVAPIYFSWAWAKPFLIEEFRYHFWIINAFYRYDVRSFFLDIFSAFLVAMITIPKTISYAAIPGFVPITGIYSSIPCIFIYWLIGKSPSVKMGPTAVMCVLLGAITSDINYAVALSLIAGLIQIIASYTGLGIVFRVAHPSLMSGFTTSAAMIIIVSQIKDLFGVSPVRRDFVGGLSDEGNLIFTLNQTNQFDIIIGMISVGLLGALHFLGKWRWPILAQIKYFVVLVAGIVSAYIMQGHWPAGHTFKMHLVGALPTGLPTPKAPIFHGISASSLISSAFVIAYVGAIEQMAILRLYRYRDYALALAGERNRLHRAQMRADRHRGSLVNNNGVAVPSSPANAGGAPQSDQSPPAVNEHHVVKVFDPITWNRELMVTGWANFLGSFFNAFPVTASFSCSAVNVQANVRSTMANVWLFIILIFTLLFLTPVFQYIPNAVMAAIVTFAVSSSLLDFSHFYYLYRLNILGKCRQDILIWVSTFALCLFLTIDQGLLLSVLLSLAIQAQNLLIQPQVPMVQSFTDSEMREHGQVNSSFIRTKEALTARSKKKEVKNHVLITPPPVFGYLLTDSFVESIIEHLVLTADRYALNIINAGDDASVTEDDDPNAHLTSITVTDADSEGGETSVSSRALQVAAIAKTPLWRLDFRFIDSVDMTGLRTLCELRRLFRVMKVRAILIVKDETIRKAADRLDRLEAKTIAESVQRYATHIRSRGWKSDDEPEKVPVQAPVSAVARNYTDAIALASNLESGADVSWLLWTEEVGEFVPPKEEEITPSEFDEMNQAKIHRDPPSQLSSFWNEFNQSLSAILLGENGDDAARSLAITKLLESTNFTSAEILPFLYLNPTHYTRNLIYSVKDSFEVILQCWNAGQQSRLTDHGAKNSECFLKVIKGSLGKKIYSSNDIRLLSEEVLNAGELAHISNKASYQLLGNASLDDICVSLHIYSPPLTRVNIVNRDRRIIEETRIPGYYSVAGLQVKSK